MCLRTCELTIDYVDENCQQLLFRDEIRQRGPKCFKDDTRVSTCTEPPNFKVGFPCPRLYSFQILNEFVERDVSVFATVIRIYVSPGRALRASARGCSGLQEIRGLPLTN